MLGKCYVSSAQLAFLSLCACLAHNQIIINVDSDQLFAHEQVWMDIDSVAFEDLLLKDQMWLNLNEEQC